MIVGCSITFGTQLTHIPVEADTRSLRRLPAASCGSRFPTVSVTRALDMAVHTNSLAHADNWSANSIDGLRLHFFFWLPPHGHVQGATRTKHRQDETPPTLTVSRHSFGGHWRSLSVNLHDSAHQGVSRRRRRLYHQYWKCTLSNWTFIIWQSTMTLTFGARG